jgi:hypothetical protein
MRVQAVFVLALALAAHAAAQQQQTAPGVPPVTAAPKPANGSAPAVPKPLNSSAPAEKPLAPLGKADKVPGASLPAGAASEYTVEESDGCVDAGAAQANSAAFVSGPARAGGVVMHGR